MSLYNLLSQPFTEEECEKYEDGDVLLWRVKPSSLRQRWIDVCGEVPFLKIDEETILPGYVEMKGRLILKRYSIELGQEYGAAVVILDQEHQARKGARTNLFARLCATVNMIANSDLLKQPIEQIGEGQKGIRKGDKMIEGIREKAKEQAELQSKKEGFKDYTTPEMSDKDLELVREAQEALGGKGVIYRASKAFEAEFYKNLVNSNVSVPDIKLLFLTMGISENLWKFNGDGENAKEVRRVTKPRMLTAYREVHGLTESETDKRVMAWQLIEDAPSQVPDQKVPDHKEEDAPPEEGVLFPEEEQDNTEPEKAFTAEKEVFGKKEESKEGYDWGHEFFDDMSFDDAKRFKWDFLGNGNEVDEMDQLDCLELFKTHYGLSEIFYNDSKVNKKLLELHPTWSDFMQNCHPGWSAFIEKD